jgi:signal transduction histidine kinase
MVALANVAVFTAGLLWTRRAERSLDDQRGQAHAELLGVLVGTLIDGRGNLRSAGLLRWEHWDEWFQDVQIAHFPDLTESSSEGDDLAGAARPSLGLEISPLGAAQRDGTFDGAGVLMAMRQAAEFRVQVEVGGGVALPVLLPDGSAWGGCWMQTLPSDAAGGFQRQLLPWFIASTLLLTLSTFALIRGFILNPVQRLAVAARRIGRGELEARVGQVSRRDEIGELMRSFDAMADDVQGFNKRLAREVDEATSAARAAEAAAMTQRRLAATGELAAGVAHEINNPLSGLMNATQALGREDLPPAKRREYLDLVASGLDRIRGTVGRLLRLAPRETATALVHLRGPLGDALGLVRHRAEDLGVEVRLAVSHGAQQGADQDALQPEALEALNGVPALQGQANELGQAFLNLLVNALDALETEPAGDGLIQVQVGNGDGGTLRIAIIDNGPGVDAELVGRIGDAFFSTKETGRGTGLGLAMVQGMAAAHGGRLEITSAKGEGFHATLVLPVAVDDPTLPPPREGV